MPLQPIQRASVIESVTEQLLAMIGDGSLRPGDKLPSTRELAATLGVGRSTVREAIQRLVMLRVLEARQGKGIFVRQPQSTDAVSSAVLFALLEAEALGDILEAREVLETALAGFAAQRATPDDLATIDRILEAERHAADLTTAIALNAEFHLAVVRAGHSPVLEKLFGSIADLVLLRQRALSQLEDSRAESLAGHQAIAAAIRRRDVTGARHAVAAHMAFNRRLVQAEQAASRAQTAEYSAGRGACQTALHREVVPTTAEPSHQAASALASRRSGLS